MTIPLANETIKEVADSYPTPFNVFHIVLKLRERGFIEKDSDAVATRKIHKWLKTEIRAGRYEITGKTLNMTRFAKITPEYLKAKKLRQQEISASNAQREALAEALQLTLGDCRLRSLGYGASIELDGEQMKRLTRILKGELPALAPTTFTPYPADCGSCRGYGHFDEDGKPTMDKRCRKCLDCNGTGEHQS